MILIDLKAQSQRTLRVACKSNQMAMSDITPKVAEVEITGDPMYSIIAMCGNKPLVAYR